MRMTNLATVVPDGVTDVADEAPDGVTDVADRLSVTITSNLSATSVFHPLQGFH